MSRSRKVFRDGKIHVMAQMCSTCIFRPGNLMRLEPGRVASLVRLATKRESGIPCHATIYGEHPNGEAICRGFFEKHKTAPLQVAERLGFIVFQEANK